MLRGFRTNIMFNFNKTTKIILLLLTLFVLNFSVLTYTHSNNQLIRLDCDYKMQGNFFCGLEQFFQSLILLFILNLICIIPILKLTINKPESKILKSITIAIIGIIFSYYISLNLLIYFK